MIQNVKLPTSAHVLVGRLIAAPLFNVLIIKFVKRHTFYTEYTADDITKHNFVNTHFSILNRFCEKCPNACFFKRSNFFV